MARILFRKPMYFEIKDNPPYIRADMAKKDEKSMSFLNF